MSKYLIVIFLLVGCQKCDSDKKPLATTSQNAPTNSAESQSKQNTNGNASVKIKELKAGDGEFVKEGDYITVHYIGKLTSGAEFSSSRSIAKPFSFQIGSEKVIKGWNVGLIGSRKGEIRQLTVPPHLAYGQAGAGEDIPPNSTLIFEIEVLSIDR